MALLRSKLESLYLQLAEATDGTNQQLSAQIKTCYDCCQLAYHKLGNEQRRYVEDLKQLQKHKEDLCQMLNAATEQGDLIVNDCMVATCIWGSDTIFNKKAIRSKLQVFESLTVHGTCINLQNIYNLVFAVGPSLSMREDQTLSTGMCIELDTIVLLEVHMVQESALHECTLGLR